MKVRILRNLGRGFPPYSEGQICDTDEADKLIQMGLAVEIPECIPAAVEAVPEKPAISTAKAGKAKQSG